MKPTYVDRLVDFLTDATRQDYSPARAVYAQIVRAHGLEPEVDEATLDEWMLKAISEGYLFATPSSQVSEQQILSAEQEFRDNGGFCTDPFLEKIPVVQQAKNEHALSHQKSSAVDRVGNTMLHVSAALGVLDSVKALIESHGILPDVENDNGETPLYKACQAGHADVVYFLLSKGAKASVETKAHNITPLHWLFTFPKEHIASVATQLVNQGGADVNTVMRPSADQSPNRFPEKVHMAHLYVFNLKHITKSANEKKSVRTSSRNTSSLGNFCSQQDCYRRTNRSRRRHQRCVSQHGLVNYALGFGCLVYRARNCASSIIQGCRRNLKRLCWSKRASYVISSSSRPPWAFDALLALLDSAWKLEEPCEKDEPFSGRLGQCRS
jgi:hypothetical protein